MTKKSLVKSISNSKNFFYSKETCNLNFTLRVDNSSELKSFHSILGEAIKDIEEILKEMKN